MSGIEKGMKIVIYFLPFCFLFLSSRSKQSLNVFFSRFNQVVELVTTWWLEINGTIHTRMLSPNTTYKAYLIVKFADRAYGLDSLPSDLSVEVKNHKSRGMIYLRYPEEKKQLLERLWMLNRIETLRPSGVATGEKRVPRKRYDGWMEIELGEFFCGESNEEVKMSLKEVKSVHLKGGLIVEGITRVHTPYWPFWAWAQI